MLKTRTTSIPLRAGLRLAIVAGIVAAAGLVAGCGSSSSSAGSAAVEKAATQKAVNLKAGEAATESSSDITRFCGAKPFKLGIIDGYGGNAWRVQVRAQIEKEAKRCPTLKGIEYVDANLDAAKYIGAINSWVTQGVNVIVAYDDFGQAAVPAFRNAEAQGVKVVTDNAIPGNAEPGKGVTASVIASADDVARGWAGFFMSALPGGKGNLIMLGGTPGNLLDPYLLSAFKKVLKEPKYSGLHLLQETPAITNWSLGETVQVVSGLINKYPTIDGMVMSYTSEIPAIHRAYSAAGKPTPALAGMASDNEVVCLVNQVKGSKASFAAYSKDGTGNMAVIALRKGVAALEGVEDPEPTTVNLPVYIDTAKGQIPSCQPKLPPGADASAALTTAQLQEVFGK